jgi:hypothetical protein
MRISIIVGSFFLCSSLTGQESILWFSIDIKEESSFDLPLACQVQIPGKVNRDLLILQRISGDTEVSVPFQFDGDKLFWMLEGPVNPGTFHYELVKTRHEFEMPVINAVKEDGYLVLKYQSKNLISYRYEIMYPPVGIDSAYERSGFIHPLWTPHGQVLTRIQPPDHYHHYGIWNPWTRVLFEGDTIDFWNLKDKKGTVHFAGFRKITEGTVFCEYEVLHEHVVFKKDGSEKVALNELQRIRVYKPQNDYYIMDMEMNYVCASQSPFGILEYRYSGLGWRTTGEWNNTNSEILTSEGKTRNDADGSRARWYIAQGSLGNDYGGAMVMSSPDNFNHPEPIRVWPADANDGGDVFTNFAPNKNTDWLIVPGKKATLKYRFIVFNGKLNSAEADNLWRYYVSSPVVRETDK